MKKKLLTTLSACVMITLCAQQSSKTELLTHLKNVRNEIQTILEEIPTEEALKTEYGTEDFLFLLHLFNEIEMIDQTFLNQNIKNLDELYLTMICEMKTVNEITQAINDIELAHNLDKMSDQKEFEKYHAQIAAIFTKHHKAYCAQHPNGTLRDLTVDEIGHPELMLANFAQKGRQLYQGLLPKLDAKIKELEMQV
jgi:hypothetical protein